MKTDPIQNLTVTKANDLVEASYRLTLNEQRLILLSIAHLDSRRPPPQGLMTIKASDYAEQYGLDLKHAYEAMEEAAEALYERDIKRIQGGLRERIRWVYHVRYHKGEGMVTLGFSPYVLPYLTQLHRQFTSYNLKQISNLRSVYSIRLYEMLKQYQSTGYFIISIQDFRDRLELGNKYERYTNLKARVIQPAVDELSIKANLEIQWRTEREGRKFTRLVFEFRERDQQQLPLGT